MSTEQPRTGRAPVADCDSKTRAHRRSIVQRLIRILNEYEFSEKEFEYAFNRNLTYALLADAVPELEGVAKTGGWEDDGIDLL